MSWAKIRNLLLTGSFNQPIAKSFGKSRSKPVLPKINVCVGDKLNILYAGKPRDVVVHSIIKYEGVTTITVNMERTYIPYCDPWLEEFSPSMLRMKMDEAANYVGPVSIQCVEV